MSPSVSAVLLVVGGLLHCGLPSATAVRANYTELFSSFDLKQRIAYRIGQVECLKTLLSDNGLCTVCPLNFSSKSGSPKIKI